MSTHEKTFLKWFGFVGGTIVAALILINLSVLGNIDVIQEKVSQNEKEILETREYHDKDIDNVMFYVRDIRVDVKEIKVDIKELIKEMK